MFNLRTGWLLLALIPCSLSAAEDKKPWENDPIVGEKAAEAPKWLCVADKSTGFKFVNGEWRTVNFDVKEDKYVVAMQKKYGRYAVTKIGEKFRTYCNEPKPNSAGFLFCDAYYEYKINVKALRYMKTYRIGFIDGNDDDANTPLIEIGKCSPL